MKALITIIGILCTLHSYAQVIATPSIRLNNAIRNEQVSLNQIKGSPYENDEFQVGYMYNLKEEDTTKALLRLNFFNDDMETRQHAGTPVQFYARLNWLEFDLNDNNYVYLSNVNGEQGIINGYFAQVGTGNTRAYFHVYQNFVPGKKARTSLEQDVKPRITNYEEWYIEFDGVMTPIELHRRRIYKAFPNFNDELKQFIKDEKLKFKDDYKDDLVKLLNYYDSLES